MRFFFFSSNIRSTKIAIRRLGVNFLAIFFFYFSYEIVLQYRAGENSKREGKFEDRISNTRSGTVFDQFSNGRFVNHRPFEKSADSCETH